MNTLSSAKFPGEFRDAVRTWNTKWVQYLPHDRKRLDLPEVRTDARSFDEYLESVKARIPETKLVTNQYGLALYLSREVVSAMLPGDPNARSFVLHFLRIETYKDVVEVTGRLAQASTLKADDKDVKRFWELYWGEMVAVEGQEVAAAMVSFGAALRNEATAELPALAANLKAACDKELQSQKDYSP